MSDSTPLLLGLLEVVGLLAVFTIRRRNVRRIRAGLGRPSAPVRVANAVLGLAVLIGFFAVPIALIVLPATRDERLRDRLRETGTPATATLLHLEETGTVVNRRPQMQVWLTVRPEGMPPFDASATWAFSVQDVQRYRPGAIVKVLFDPQDHDSVAVVGLVDTGA